MKHWVVVKNEIDNNSNNDYYEFVQVDTKTMSDAIYEVEKGLVVVSPYFKKNYPKYRKMWEYLNKRYDKITNEGYIEDIESYCEIVSVGGHRLYFDAIMYSKHYVEIDFSNFNVNITNLSDYSFEQVMLYLTSVYDYVKGNKELK